MTFTTMTSFAPLLPSLPSYPRHLAPSREASPSEPRRHSNKKARQSHLSSTASYTHRSYTNPYSPPLTPDATDSDDGLMTHSIYSDQDYRSSLVGSRKRGLADDDVDDPHFRREPDYAGDGRTHEEGGGKRRIIDVVGGTLGGVLRSAWEMFRPRLPWSAPSPPPVLEVLDEKMEDLPVLRRGASWGGTEEPRQQWGAEDRRRATWESPMPGQWNNSLPPPRTSSRRWNEGSPPPTARSAASYFDSPASMATTITESGMNARWVMVSPAPVASLASKSSKSTIHTRSHSSPSTTPRRPRPVSSKKRALKVPRSPPLQSSAFTFSNSPSSRPPSSRSKKKCGSRERSALGLEEDEMDDDMRRFNDRLKAMIREGKEALGATIEVVYDDDDDVMGMY